jgi:signal peptidase I
VTERAEQGRETRAERRRAANRRRPRRRGSFWRELPVLLIVAFVLALLIKTFLVQAFFIPSGSMEKTLHGCPGCSGDRVLVNKLVYRFHDPQPGDIVVFQGPSTWQPEVRIAEPSNPIEKFFRAIGQAIGVAQPNEKDFVKRVIAVGGQTVACCDAKGRVTVDHRSLNEPYIFENSPDVNGDACPEGRRFGPITVPKGRLWVMGDHRGFSADSRCHIADQFHGTIGVKDVIGKAFVIVWPPSRWNTLGTPPTFRNVSSGPLGDGVPLGMGLVGALPVVGLRRWRANRRLRSRRPPGPRRPGDRGWWRSRWRAGRR